MTVPRSPFTSTVLGHPRIGPRRELKRALEQYWSGAVPAAELHALAARLRHDDRAAMAAAGLDSVPANTFSFYDQVLDTAALLGAVPERYLAVGDPLDRYFAMARGTAELPALEMTKWFDTNYHYIVPELSAATRFSLHPDKVLADLGEAVAQGIPARPVVLGPLSFLLLSKSVDGTDLVSRLDELVPLYVELLELLAAGGASWVQLDEPVLVQDRSSAELAAATDAYRQLAASATRPGILVATYFGDGQQAVDALAATGIDGLAVDLVAGATPVGDLSELLVVAGVVDGRNIWRTDPDRALADLRAARELSPTLAVSTSCSLLHVPYSLAPETALDEELRNWLAFAQEKLDEVRLLARLLHDPELADHTAVERARVAVAGRRNSPRIHRSRVQDRVKHLSDKAFRRGDATHRASLQAARTPLPPLPTTTIGSFPQTPRVRRARADLRSGTIDQQAYVQQMQAEIAEVVALQEELGLDVVVHGEPERNDMVQYFAEQLEGFAATDFGWVQSYGSRCVRPPVLFGDVERTSPMTVAWSAYARSLTPKPVKGMLTGPVTILAWSFVRDDQPLADTAFQVALAIRDETVDLQQAGIAIIQVDEPALRELLPLRAADRPAYLDWAVRSFRLSTSGVSDSTSIHTHLCYSEFGEIIGSISDLDADVTSVEAARSRMELLDALADIGYRRGIGPGVYDIHSPRIPSTEEISTALELALRAVPSDRLWVNPDCGLKTRRPDEVRQALTHLVEAAAAARLLVTQG